MRNRRTAALVLAVLLAVSIVGPSVAMAQTAGIVKGEPRLSVHAPDGALTPGTAEQLEIQISNDGEVSLGSPSSRDVVTAARNVRVDVEGEGPIEIETNQQAIGTVTESQPRTISVEARVPEGAETGEYELDIELKYSHTKRIEQGAGVMIDRDRTVTKSLDVEVEDGPRFDIETVEDNSQIGDTGPVTAEIENIGNERAEDLTVRLSSLSDQSRISFAGAASDEASIGSLDPEETARIEFDVTVKEEATPRGYPIEADIEFDDSEGIRSSDLPRRLAVTPDPEQQFSFENVESTLRVGEEGEIRGTVANDGPRSVQSVVVRFTDESPNIVPIEDSVAVGSLEPGASESFELPIEVTTEAESVPRNFDMAVAYRNADNERRLFEDVDIAADIDEQRDEFTLDTEGRELQAGSSTLVDVEVTNNLDETVTDVEAKLFTDDPLGSDDDEGYIEALEPGESTTVTFRVNAGSSATPRTYPLQMDFRYDDESGTSKVSDTYRTAVVVTEPSDEGTPWLIVGAVIALVIIIGAGLYWGRGRR
jgi:hypothetical protein